MKKALNVIQRTSVILIVVLALLMMIFTIFSVTTVNRSDRDLFGYKAFIVQSDSMSATDFNAGALIFVKEVDPATLQEGDVISFMSQGTAGFETVTHKIRKKTVDANGKPGFITYGTTTNTDDATVVTYPYILGKYEGQIPGLGTFFNFLKSTPGYFLCIFLPFALLILCQGIKCVRLFRRYKKEQTAELDAEREQLREEREENARMLEQLQALKAELEAKTNPASAEDKENA